MVFRCDDYTVRPVSVYAESQGGNVIAPEVTLRYNGGHVGRYVSWALAHYLEQHRQHFGKPPWREYLSLELRLVAVDGRYQKYAIL